MAGKVKYRLSWIGATPLSPPHQDAESSSWALTVTAASSGNPVIMHRLLVRKTHM